MDDVSTKCVQCGTVNRSQARYCGKCGAALQSGTEPASEANRSTEQLHPGEATSDTTTSSTPSSPQSSEVTPAAEAAEQTTARIYSGVDDQAKHTAEAEEAKPDSQPPASARGPVPEQVIYVALESCSNCGATSQGQVTSPVCQCGSPIATEPRRVVRYPHALTSTQKRIASLKLEHPFLVAVRDITDSAAGSSVFYEYVKGKSLQSLDGPISLKQANRWTTQLANLTDYLHKKGVAVFNNNSSLDRLLITEKGLMLKDLLESDPLPADRRKRDILIDRDVRFVARVFSFLTTGEDPADTGRIVPKLPNAVAAILSHTASEVQASAQDLFRDLRRFLAQTEAPALTVDIGKRTDTGRERELNEDTVYAGQISVSTAKRPAYLGLVADGMGGHAAGEVASQDTVNSIQHDLSARLRQASTAQELRAVAEQDLKWAIERANQMVWQKAQTRGTNMGTTLVAALLIGDTAYIANVGDSRAYLFRQGQLEQITDDHSLVARLVAMGQLAPDEAYTHPQRNEIYRFLGQSRNVEVDVFVRTLEAGDQLLLCSDGLWEMVRDPQTQRILATSINPQAACETLIEQANANGGEDNISAVVLVVK